MKEKILAALKIRYKNLGFTDKAFEGVAEYMAATVTEEDQIETAIGGVEGLLKAFQGDIDRRVNDAILKTKAERQPVGGEDPNRGKEPSTDLEKAIAAAISPLLAKVEQLEASRYAEQMNASLHNTLKEKGIPEKYFTKIIAGRTFKDKAEVESFAAEVESGWREFEQDLTNKGFSKQERPLLGVTNQDGVTAATQAYIEGKKASESGGGDLGGKKL
jgi:hypothetical protein